MTHRRDATADGGASRATAATADLFAATDPADLVAALDQANARVARAQRELLGLIREAACREIWRDEGARDLAHWLSIRYGISSWKASAGSERPRPSRISPRSRRRLPPAS